MLIRWDPFREMVDIRRRMGSFARSITLPSTVSADRIDARYEDGVLKLRLPKAEAHRDPKRQVNQAAIIKLGSSEG